MLNISSYSRASTFSIRSTLSNNFKNCQTCMLSMTRFNSSSSSRFRRIPVYRLFPFDRPSHIVSRTVKPACSVWRGLTVLHAHHPSHSRASTFSIRSTLSHSFKNCQTCMLSITRFNSSSSSQFLRIPEHQLFPLHRPCPIVSRTVKPACSIWRGLTVLHPRDFVVFPSIDLFYLIDRLP